MTATPPLTRAEAQALLPFQVNGTLDGPEAAALAAWLARDADLRDEAAALAALRATLQAEPVDSPGQAGLDRLMAGLDAATPANLPRPPRLWQAAAAVLLAIAVGQAVLLFGRGADPGGYTLARAGAPALTVAFDPDATEAQIRAALLDADLVIVDGPSALGLYGLAPRAEGDAAAAAARLAASGLTESLTLTEPE